MLVALVVGEDRRSLLFLTTRASVASVSASRLSPVFVHSLVRLLLDIITPATRPSLA